MFDSTAVPSLPTFNLSCMSSGACTCTVHLCTGPIRKSKVSAFDSSRIALLLSPRLSTISFFLSPSTCEAIVMGERWSSFYIASVYDS